MSKTLWKAVHWHHALFILMFQRMQVYKLINLDLDSYVSFVVCQTDVENHLFGCWIFSCCVIPCQGIDLSRGSRNHRVLSGCQPLSYLNGFYMLEKEKNFTYFNTSHRFSQCYIYMHIISKCISIFRSSVWR